MKKTISLLLAAILSLGMATAAFAANDKITKQTAALPDVDTLERGPGYEVWIPLDAANFEPATLADPIMMTDVKNSKITVRQSVKSGAKAIDTVELKADSNKVANILVTLKEPFFSTDSLDFDVAIYLLIDGTRQSFETRVTGTLKNSETEVYSSDDYVDLSAGQVAVCEETAKKVEADLGNNVAVFVRMQKGKKYYGISTVGPDASDDGVLSEYPDIENVYTLSTIGLNAPGNNVKFDIGDDLYVYDGDLNYLGKTSDMLPYSTKYYLAGKKLDVVSTDEPDTDEPDDELGEPIEDPDALDGDTLPYAPSGNPGTGVTPMLSVAVAVGLVSLAAAGAALSGRKKN